MIKLTLRDGTPWYVNPDHIVDIYPRKDVATVVGTIKEEISVTESPDC
jgi:uncharacterized protein YlzI (FlbEa/FlbD family)